MQSMRCIPSIGVSIVLLGLVFHPLVATAAEDFFDKLKRAAEQSVQQQQQPPTRQPRAQQPGRSAQPQRQAAAKPSTEPPQPSADFGTPEATAKIAAQAGFLDVVGIKLGTPAKEAIEGLKAFNKNFKIMSHTLREYEALPGVVMTPHIEAAYQPTNREGNPEHISLMLTYSPNEAFVWGISRNTSFGTEAQRPTVNTFVDGLRKKYGNESTKYLDTRLIWVFDDQGQQVMGQMAWDIFSKCSEAWIVGSTGGLIAGNRPDHNNQYGNSNFDKQLVKGYYQGSQGKDFRGGICHSHSLINIHFLHAIPRGSAADLVMNMDFKATNRQLEASAVTASHTVLLREATKLAQQRKEESEKRGGPQF